MAGLSLTGCHQSTVYSRYEHIDDDGWERNDSLFFDLPAIQWDGRYATLLQLRTENAYPYQSLVVWVEQTVWPSGRYCHYAVNCRLTDDKGRVTGKGVGYHSYQFPIDTLTLQTGDSLHICVTHHMRREFIPGVADVGISLSALHQYAGK